MAEVEMDRHYRILKRVIFELPPLADETPEDTALRQQLTTGVNEIRARKDSVDPSRSAASYKGMTHSSPD